MELIFGCFVWPIRLVVTGNDCHWVRIDVEWDGGDVACMAIIGFNFSVISQLSADQTQVVSMLWHWVRMDLRCWTCCRCKPAYRNSSRHSNIWQAKVTFNPNYWYQQFGLNVTLACHTNRLVAKSDVRTFFPPFPTSRPCDNSPEHPVVLHKPTTDATCNKESCIATDWTNNRYSRKPTPKEHMQLSLQLLVRWWNSS
jgi:hypothetical protein